MSGSIFVLHDGGNLVEARETAYDSEALLQLLLARYPNLLAGDQINPEAPRRWVLVSREMEVPDSSDSAGRRWSLDHLFLDQDAVPTLVEVKRSSDTRIRREVIGQMLDYAANAVVYWPVERIQASFGRTCEESGLDAEVEIAALLGEEASVEEFWQRVKTNLQAGRIRMVFVADAIPSELRRIIEFLNTQMDPAEVLGVEIRQFVGEGLKTLVPRVIGQTESAVQAKTAGRATSPGPVHESISEAEFWKQFDSIRSPEQHHVAAEIIACCRRAGLTDFFRTTNKGVVFNPQIDGGRPSNSHIYLDSGGFVRIALKRLKSRPPFTNPDVLAELHRRLIELPGFETREKGMDGMPVVTLESLETGDWRKRFIGTLDWIVRKLREP